MGNIRDMESAVASIWDWHFLNDCFTRGITVADIDGIIERHGYFLVLEAKRPGAGQPLGQKILYENMVKTGLFTVVYFWGKDNDPDSIECVEVLKPEKWGERGRVISSGKIPYNKGKFINLVGRWYKKANSTPRIKN